MNMSVTSVLTDEALAAERRYLMNYATFKLRDTDLANDAVQETLVAAIEAKDKFAGRSSLRTWLVSILRNKIYDLLATRRTELPTETVEPDGEDDGTSGSVFDTHGRWGPGAKPQVWGSPESTMEQKQFWQIFQQCLKGMPARLQEVFVLREVMGEPIDAICKNLGITQSNCSVMLYRARMRLRPCLQVNWYDAAEKRMAIQ
jgi:RNA polymerase sigma-70 factor (ECF subfamily)